MADFSSKLIETVRVAAQYWKGYRYFIASADPTAVQIAGIGVTSVTFPTIDSNIKTVPTLSSSKTKLPTEITTTPLILKAPVSRTFGLYKFMNDIQLVLAGGGTVGALLGGSTGEFKPFTLAIALNESTSAIDILPLRIWVAEGCIASKYTPPSADAISSPSRMPEEVLELEVIKFYQLL